MRLKEEFVVSCCVGQMPIFSTERLKTRIHIVVFVVGADDLKKDGVLEKT